jgi:malonyl-CoA O-methyltransferase
MSKNTSAELHFSRAAAVYHTRAELQRAAACKLLQYQSGPEKTERILELGCGTGFLTEHLIAHFAQAHIDAIDISAAMIEQAQREVAANKHVDWHVSDVWKYQPLALYDLIASSSSLQWMQPLDALFAHLAHWLEPGGRLLCSLMVEGTLGELHRLRREIAPQKTPRDRLPSLTDTVAYLQGAGFCITKSEQDVLQAEYESTEDFLRSIRELGFTGGPLATSSPLLTRGELKRLVQSYSAQCALPGGGVGASFVIYSFEAFKGATESGRE